MSTIDISSFQCLKNLLKKQFIATMDEMKDTLEANNRMTVFRKLKKIGYCTSYSHAGRYYALKEIVQYNKRGLWSFGNARFSKYGTLKETSRTFIERSERGYSSFELTSLLNVETSKILWELHREGKVEREKLGGVYIYYTGKSATKKRRQQLMRKERDSITPDEVKAAIIIFYSMLNERERRLFSGLESLRIGHGGDKRISELLGTDVHVVAKGRREIQEDDCDAGRSRQKGGGRKAVKKNS